MNIPDLPKRLVQLIAAASVVRMIAAGVLEFGNDEAYYFLYAIDLQANYFDHPPGVAWLIRLFTLNLMLTDEFFVRLGAIVCAAVGTWLAYRLGIALKNEQTGWFAAILYTSSIYTSLIAGTFIVPDSPQVVAWLGAMLAMHKIVSVPADQEVPLKSWATFGLLSGIAILCKVHGLFLWASLGGYLVLYSPKRLMSRGIFVSGLITAILILPIFYWNFRHDFITYRFHSERVDMQSGWIHPGDFIQAVFGQLLYSNPVNAGLIILAFWKSKTIKFLSTDSLRFVLLNGVPIVAVVSVMSLFNPMLPHWSGPGFLALSFLAAAYLDEIKGSPESFLESRVLKISTYALGVILILTVLVVEFYPGTFGNHNKRRFGDDDFTLDLYGWRNFSDTFEPWLAEQEKTGAVSPGLPLVCNKWFPAAHIEYYVARPLGRPVIGVGRVMDLHHFLWLNRIRKELKPGDDALCIIPSNYFMIVDESYGLNFKSTELLKVFYSYRGGKMARYFTVYLLKDYQANDEARRTEIGLKGDHQ